MVLFWLYHLSDTYIHIHGGSVRLDDVRVVGDNVGADVAQAELVADLLVLLI